MITPAKAAFINSLADEDGRVDPEVLVQAAKDPASPVHGDFDWDVQAAAKKHWLSTAQSLIRLVRITMTVENQTLVVPHYVPDPKRPSKSKKYVDITFAATNREMSRQIMLSEMDRIASAIRRAQDVATVLGHGLGDELDAWLGTVQSVRAKVEVKAPAQRRGTSKTSRGRRAA